MSSFTWAAENKLQLTLLYVQAPFCFTVGVRVLENSITLNLSCNVGQSETDDIVGRA